MCIGSGRENADAAVHGGAWLDEASGYVRANADGLARVPVWLFSVGMARAVGGWFEKHARDPEDITQLCEGFDLREHRALAGALRPEHIPLAGRALYRLMGGRYDDFRDWEEIDAWADTIAADLSATGTPDTASR